LGRSAASRTLIKFCTEFVSLSDLGRRSSVNTAKQVMSIPTLEFELSLSSPPYGLPTSYELVRLIIAAPDASSPTLLFCVDDSLLEICQVLGQEIAEEMTVESKPCISSDPDRDTDAKNHTDSSEQDLPPVASQEEFRYVCLSQLEIPAVPLCIDLQISKPVYLSFTGLTVTFPEVHLSRVVTTGCVLGQELLAHCIAFLLLNSPILLGSCDLLGNPVQVYRHLRSGLGDLMNLPLREGLQSCASHISSASLTSVSAVSDSIRRNLPAAPVTESSTAAPGEGGLAVGARALLDGVGRGIVGVIKWDQHTPEREGPIGHLRGVRNAMTGVVAHPVGGILDFVTATTRGWSARETTVLPVGSHSTSCLTCHESWDLSPAPEVSPLKFHLQCCQSLPRLKAIPAVLFWSPRCELVRVDGADAADGRPEPNLRLVRAGLLLTTAQLCVIVGAGAAHVLDLSAVQAVQESRGRPSALVTIASVTGRIWQLHVRGEPGELVAHVRRARKLLGLPPIGT